MSKRFYEKMFTEGVKHAQEHYGSRKAFERIETTKTSTMFEGLGDAETDFVETRDGFYMATVNEDGQPYIQFRGGPPGFLRVIDDRTLAFADFRGNLQYISIGNLKANDRAALFLMDYGHRRRLKVLARVEVKEALEAPALIRQLQSPGYKGTIERAMILHVDAFDWNCPQHITQRFTIHEINVMAAPLNAHIAKLEAEILELRTKLKGKTAVS